MKSTSDTIRIVSLSALTSIVVVLVSFGLLWSERVSIANYIVAHEGGAPGSVVVGSADQKSVISAVEKANPAVVAISISKNVPVLERYNYNPFSDLFGGGFNFSVPGVRQNGSKLQEVGGGSGFLVSSDGLIVTNKHVVSDPSAEYTVFTNDGKKHIAKVVARDPFIDIAVIKIDGVGYPSLSFSTANPVLGQTVISIGNALGEFRNTVSVGVVSGLSRSITAGDELGGQSETLDEVIQTDAAINPGNSGGPLLDVEGNIVGVNVAVAVDSQNIGFALPAKGLDAIVQSVKISGKIVHPYLGVRYVEITPAVKNAKKVSVDHGVLVEGGGTSDTPAVISGSPADTAGIKEGDIITAIDGVTLDDEHKLSSIIRSKNIGDKVILKVLRGGQERTLSVTLEEYKNS